MRTTRQQNIEQVSHIMVTKSLIPGMAYGYRDAEQDNREGWAFEVRYDWEGYLTDRNCTLVEGLVLGNEDLQEAWQTARAKLPGD